MAEIVTWHGVSIGGGGYGWNSMGVVVMSERHPEEEHPLRGPGEEGPPASEPSGGEDEKEDDKEEEKT